MEEVRQGTHQFGPLRFYARSTLIVNMEKDVGDWRTTYGIAPCLQQFKGIDNWKGDWDGGAKMLVRKSFCVPGRFARFVVRGIRQC